MTVDVVNHFGVVFTGNSHQRMGGAKIDAHCQRVLVWQRCLAGFVDVEQVHVSCQWLAASRQPCGFLAYRFI